MKSCAALSRPYATLTTEQAPLGAVNPSFTLLDSIDQCYTLSTRNRSIEPLSNCGHLLILVLGKKGVTKDNSMRPIFNRHYGC